MTITFTPEGAWVDDGRWPWLCKSPLDMITMLIRWGCDGTRIRVTERMYDR